MSFMRSNRSLCFLIVLYPGSPSNLFVTPAEHCHSTRANGFDLFSSSIHFFSLFSLYSSYQITLSNSSASGLGFEGSTMCSSFSSLKICPMSSPPLYSFSTTVSAPSTLWSTAQHTQTYHIWMCASQRVFLSCLMPWIYVLLLSIVYFISLSLLSPSLCRTYGCNTHLIFIIMLW